MARVVALILATQVLLLACWLLFALHQPEAATAIGAVAFAGFAGGVLIAAGSVPHERIRSAAENARLGLVFVAGGVVLVLAGAAVVGVTGHWVSGAIEAITGAVLAALGTGKLGAARMLRLVPALVSHDEEPRALALGANAMPGRTRSLVVATDRRIAWAEGRRFRERHALRLDDVDRFEADRRAGALTVMGGGETLRVRPVPRRELEKFERLLGRARRR